MKNLVTNNELKKKDKIKQSKSKINNPNVEIEEDDSSKLEESFYYALNHEIRRKIIKLIGTSGESSFTIFKKTLKISTGTLYHHLDVLKDIITQNEKRKYILTPLGKHAYNFLVKNYDSLESNNIDQQKSISKPLENLIKYLVPTRLYSIVGQNKKLGLLITLGIWIISFLLIFLGEADSSLMFIIPYTNRPEITINIRIALGFKFIGGVVGSAIISEILCRYLFQKEENTISFLLSYSIGLLPIVIYLGIFNIFKLISQGLVESPFNKLVMIIFQLWAIWLISYSLIKFKYLKLERSLIITFLIHYGAVSILLFSSL